MRRGVAVAFAVGLFGMHGVARADELDVCVDASGTAQKLRDEGKFRLAREQMLLCARDVCPGPVKKDCAEMLEKLDVAAPTVVLGAKDPRGRDAIQVRVKVDGQALVERLDGKPLLVDPGEHVLRFEMEGAKPIDERVVIRTGEKNRVITVTFTPADAGGPPATVPETPTSGGGGVSFLPWALIGVGAVGLGLFTYFGLKGKGEIDDLKNTCGKTSSCAQSDVDDAKGKLVVADVSGALGLVAAGVGVYLLVTQKPAPATVTTGSELEVAPVAGGAVAGLRGAW
jgi:hypothetical protein